VAAGDLILKAARLHNVALLPIDSEHNAVHQCLRGGKPSEVKQIWLTASGGPFRNTPLADFEHITPEQALKHPTWVMGQRITIDSATMMNKGFEIIEACRLFDLPPAKVRVTIHPQSTVHSLVEFVDGSILAQISVTDMRLPILYALAYPDRPAAPQLSFDLAALSQLDFAPPDFVRFPCLRLAYEAAESGPAACIALNAADEIAVAAFLGHEPAGRIPFLAIPRTIEEVLIETSSHVPASIQEVLAADEAARTCARSAISRHAASEVRT
jgi:1-deoxy-D-xylulose-5-phosphate reductoisomerase